MNLPNKLTVARIIATPFFIVTYMRDMFIISLIIFILASVTDMVDGKIARKYDLITDFGKIMDPLADKVLVYSAFCLLVGDAIRRGACLDGIREADTRCGDHPARRPRRYERGDQRGQPAARGRLRAAAVPQGAHSQAGQVGRVCPRDGGRPCSRRGDDQRSFRRSRPPRAKAMARAARRSRRQRWSASSASSSSWC